MKNKVPKDEKEVIEILVNHCKNFYGCKCIGCGFFDGCGEYYREFELVKNKVDMEGKE